MRHQAKILKHHSHLVAADINEVFVGFFQKIFAVEKDLAVRGFNQPRQAAHHRGLARARQPHDDKNLTDMNVKTDICSSRDRPVSAHSRAELRCRYITNVGLKVRRVFARVDFPDIPARQLHLTQPVFHGAFPSWCTVPGASPADRPRT